MLSWDGVSNHESSVGVLMHDDVSDASLLRLVTLCFLIAISDEEGEDLVMGEEEVEEEGEEEEEGSNVYARNFSDPDNTLERTVISG